jgi:ABC-2 type transport system permease protein
MPLINTINRQLSTMNILGTYTLFKKEVWRFLKVYNQTLVAPVVTSLLFFAVFSLSVGTHVANIGGVPFNQFMASGLIIMTVVQQSFANTSSSLVMSKVIGMIIDFLMPPLSAAEMVLAMVGAAILRGIMVAIIGGLALWCFVPIHIEHFGTTLFYLIFASMLLAQLGLLAGVVSESFDHMAAITSYVITPLAFLSGTFYSIAHLPPVWQKIAHINPFFYMIDGFRYGMTGYADASITIGAMVLIITNIALLAFTYRLIKRGYRLKG